MFKKISMLLLPLPCHMMGERVVGTDDHLLKACLMRPVSD